jgi:hypothetical protein
MAGNTIAPRLGTANDAPPHSRMDRRLAGRRSIHLKPGILWSRASISMNSRHQPRLCRRRDLDASIKVTERHCTPWIMWALDL